MKTIHQKEHIALFLRPQPDSVAMDHTTQDSSSAAGAAEVDGRRHEEKEDSQSSDKFPAPSTPQLEAEQSSRSLDDRDREDQLNCSIDVLKEYFRDPMEHTGFGAPDSQSVDNTCKSPAVEISKEETSTPAELSTEKKPHPAHQSRDNECAHPEDPLAPSPHLDPDERLVQNADDLNRKKASPHHTSSYLDDSRSNKKRIKVDWTPDLHRRFVQAVEQLGIDQAIPSKILELMKVEGLTRHNVASHLQKYRMRKRHILPKDEDRRWQQQGNQVPRGYTYQPFVALPPAHSSCVMPPGQVYHVWGHPNYPFPGVQMWGGATGCSPWQPTGEYWPWKTYPRMHADAWGYPVAPQNLYPVAPQNPPQNRCFDAHEHQQSASKDAACDFHPAEEVIDEVVREALNKPWLPLPLGLKPPSTESVLTELHRLGVHSVPPR